ncbi:putative membrane transport protein [Helianthus annuus]|uniref:Auxin efflux carrier component n=1 Tax=Helianthus annuus TaxID=4232 RepID=A0A251T7M3_HELAN|nr:probable auxin efflux carrier component 8 [Helianthus annuus]KAF5764129.1 putative membrane transport protein [Helianthus annuus]KAJ0450848.1 putative membrane transport protein [Helianthus annuus]KAJ0455160.1 putative membrane transport protein [Helianthus annuus]KAJ0472711.1 putative membrane transport protein [Helianthus annuus]KAJ0648315.1 putative membrane transport protein [Helianthus annuus]
MITGRDFYAIVTAMVPLYVAMILAYGSVKWWKIFTPDQCSGINRFVAIFAVPLLSFHFISMGDPYAMNWKFIAADSLQKIIMLVVLGFWAKFTKTGSFEWMITIFSLSTLPNSLVIGIPLLTSMYGELTAPLMIQVVVMQCILWYTILLFLFEFRAAKALIMERFPGAGGDIGSIKVDSDVVSLDAQDVLETTAEMGNDGKLHVTVRRSNASRRSVGVGSVLSGAEIFSLNSSAVQSPRGSYANHSDFNSMVGFPGGRLSNFGPADDMYSIQSSRGVTPRQSNCEDEAGRSSLSMVPHFSVNSETHIVLTKDQQPPQMVLRLKPELQQNGSQKKPNHDDHMFGRSSSAPIISKGGRSRSKLYATMEQSTRPDHGKLGELKEFDVEIGGDREKIKPGVVDSAAEHQPSTVTDPNEGSGQQMPSARVMGRLILLMVSRKLLRNPNTYASILGLVWALVSFRWHWVMPKIIGNSISLISNAGLGMAMFSLGLFMALQPKLIACGRSKALLSIVVKFLIGPIVSALAAFLVGLHGTLFHITIVQATLSVGIVPFVFAKEYDVHATILSTSVIFGMLITVPITLCYYIILQL